MADVVMGFLFTHPHFAAGDGILLGLLLAASTSLYWAGMVLNDVFDVRIDARQRPGRPLPSRGVSVAAARRLGWTLLIVGLGLAWVAAGVGHGTLRPGLVGTLLAAAIVLYDAFLKRTVFGPVGMGACRLLNVLLGMSFAAGPWQREHWLVAAALGVYIVGVTWFARTETARSRRAHLVLALAVMLGGVVMLNWVPQWNGHTVRLLQLQPIRWSLLIGGLGLLIVYRCFRAVLEPTPRRVQAAVRHGLLSLVMLDAAICFVVWGLPGAIVIMLLLVPTVFLGQWLYST